ncbi:hypothetical protein Dimus_011919 [Dionaea muscipula]
MSSGMVENGGSVVIQAVGIPMPTPPPTPTPQPHRRPRVREVSSRFMSSLTPSSSSSTTSSSCTAAPKYPLSKPMTPMPSSRTQQARSRSVQRQRNQDSEADENRPETNVRRSDSSIGTTLMRPRFKEEDRARIDTPVPSAVDVKYRRANLSAVDDSGAAKVLQFNGTPFCTRGLNQGGKVNIRSRSPKASPVRKHHSVGTEETLNQRGVDTPYERGGHSEKLNNSHLQMSATPDGRRSWMSSTSSGDSLKVSASSCARSLDFPFTNQEQSLFHSVKPNQKSASFSLKSSSDFGKLPGGAFLPPVPPGSKLGIDTKGKKGSGHQEEVHQLRLLHNRYLQWRYTNARAEASMIVRKRESERLLYSLGPRMSELRDSVKTKRTEVEFLQRMKTLFAIVEAQMPYLDEWSVLEGDHSSSLLGTIEALSNVSSQLPMDGNVKHDVQEVAEVLNSAVKAMESTFRQVQSFTPQAEQVDSWISELARVFGGERALVEECGELLQNRYKSQVEESSLRGLLLQLHKFNVSRAKEETQSSS